MVAALMATLPCAATNTLWNVVVTNFVIEANTPFSSAVRQLEGASKGMDPWGRGIRIVYGSPYGEQAGPALLRISTKDLLLKDVVKIVVETAGYEVRFMGDVAVCCQRQMDGPPVCRTGVLHGLVKEASTATPVTNVMLTTADLLQSTNTVWSKADGSFTAAITYMARRPYCCGIALYEPKDDMVKLLVSAPGYRPCEAQVDMRDSMDQPNVNITLTRETNANNGGHGTLAPKRGQRP